MIFKLVNKIINVSVLEDEVPITSIKLTENISIRQGDRKKVGITISPKNRHGNSRVTKILPKLKISNHLSLNNTESNETKNNIILNETELSQSFSENSIKALQRNFLHKKKKKNRICHTKYSF